jgi:type IV pilus assembly protein PilB
MPVTPEIGSIIMRGGNQLDIEQQAKKENVPDLRQAGLKKVKDGITSLDEIERATNE